LTQGDTGRKLIRIHIFIEIRWQSVSLKPLGRKGESSGGICGRGEPIRGRRKNVQKSGRKRASLFSMPRRKEEPNDLMNENLKVVDKRGHGAQSVYTF